MDQPIKVVKAQGTPNRTTSTIEIDAALPRAARDQLKQDIGDFLVEQILLSVADQKSPVDGEDWPGLTSAEYRKKKFKEVGNRDANMDLHGDMLNSLMFEETKDGIEVGFFDSEAWKADGHNKFSGKENGTPKRRFLPDEGQEFIPSIQKGIENLVADAQVGSSGFTASDFDGITTKSDLYSYLMDQLDGLARSEVRDAVLRNPELVDLLDELDLLDLL